MKTKFNIGDTVYTYAYKTLLILKIKGITIQKVGKNILEQYYVEKNHFYEKIDASRLFRSKSKAYKYFSKKNKELMAIQIAEKINKIFAEMDTKNSYEPEKRVDE